MEIVILTFHKWKSEPMPIAVAESKVSLILGAQILLYFAKTILQISNLFNRRILCEQTAGSSPCFLAFFTKCTVSTRHTSRIVSIAEGFMEQKRENWMFCRPCLVKFIYVRLLQTSRKTKQLYKITCET